MTDAQVFQINDYEWWVGVCTPNEVLETYMQVHQMTREEATGGEEEFPRALGDDELDTLTYWEEGGLVRSFREQLAIECRSGIRAPRFFAGVDI